MVILLIVIERHQVRLFGQYIPLSARSLIPSLLPRGEGRLDPSSLPTLIPCPSPERRREARSFLSPNPHPMPFSQAEKGISSLPSQLGRGAGVRDGEVRSEGMEGWG